MSLSGFALRLSRFALHASLFAKLTVTVVPCPAALSTVISPPQLSTS